MMKAMRILMVVTRDRAEIWIYIRKMMMMMWMVWWTPPESHKAGRCSLGIGITLLGCLSGINGPVKVLLVPSQAQRHVPTHWLRGRWPRRRVSREG